MITRVAPYFPVADVAATVSYYRQVLGFTEEYSAGTPPQFAIVSRDGCPVMFRAVEDPAQIRPVATQGGTWDAFFWVQDVRALAASFGERGVEFSYPIITQPYGMVEFAIRDRDGHVLGFGQEVPT
jgi:uncharacterized glyoxalase superfamily protein PhnB